MKDATIARIPPAFDTLTFLVFNGYITGNEVSFSLVYRLRIVVHRRCSFKAMKTKMLNLKKTGTHLEVASGTVFQGKLWYGSILVLRENLVDRVLRICGV